MKSGAGSVQENVTVIQFSFNVRTNEPAQLLGGAFYQTSFPSLGFERLNSIYKNWQTEDLPTA